MNEIPKETIPGSENPDDPFYMDIWNGIYEGSGKAVGDTIEGLETLLKPRTYISMGYNGAKYVISSVNEHIIPVTFFQINSGTLPGKCAYFISVVPECENFLQVIPAKSSRKKLHQGASGIKK